VALVGEYGFNIRFDEAQHEMASRRLRFLPQLLLYALIFSAQVFECAPNFSYMFATN
jgi:hypothetical protein